MGVDAIHLNNKPIVNKFKTQNMSIIYWIQIYTKMFGLESIICGRSNRFSNSLKEETLVIQNRRL